MAISESRKTPTIEAQEREITETFWSSSACAWAHEAYNLFVCLVEVHEDGIQEGSDVPIRDDLPRIDAIAWVSKSEVQASTT